MQKLGFPLYETKFLTKQATFPPLRDRSDLTRSCPSISSSLLKFALSSFVSLNSITVTYVSLVMYRISSILGRSLFTLKWMKCMLHALLRFPEKESGWWWILSAKRLQLWKGRSSHSISFLSGVVDPGIKFISPDRNRINLKYDPYLFKWTFGIVASVIYTFFN